MSISQRYKIGGNPVKLLRKRFSDKAIEFLLKLAWWDWPIVKITAHLDAITQANFATVKKLIWNKYVF